MKIDLIKFIILCTTFASHLSYAGNTEELSVGLGAHVHGWSELMIAMEDKALEIELRSPATNLVGFEHKATTKKDIAAIENALSLLARHELLFSFSGGNCSLTNTTVDISGLTGNNDHDHDHDHDHEKNNHSHDEHKDNHAEHDNHSDIIANYHYNCEEIATLTSITVDFFEIFSGIQQIRAMWITEKRQDAKTLSSKNNTIDLR